MLQTKFQTKYHVPYPRPVGQVALEIRRVRHLAELSQVELAQMIGVSQNRISEFELGKIVPRMKTLQRIVDATGQRLVVVVEPKS